MRGPCARVAADDVVGDRLVETVSGAQESGRDEPWSAWLFVQDGEPVRGVLRGGGLVSLLDRDVALHCRADGDHVQVLAAAGYRVAGVQLLVDDAGCLLGDGGAVFPGVGQAHLFPDLLGLRGGPPPFATDRTERGLRGLLLGA